MTFEQRVAALKTLVHMALDGPAVRATLEARIEEGQRIRKQMFEEAKVIGAAPLAVPVTTLVIASFVNVQFATKGCNYRRQQTFDYHVMSLNSYCVIVPVATAPQWLLILHEMPSHGMDNMQESNLLCHSFTLYKCFVTASQCIVTEHVYAHLLLLDVCHRLRSAEGSKKQQTRPRSLLKRHNGLLKPTMPIQIPHHMLTMPHHHTIQLGYRLTATGWMQLAQPKSRKMTQLLPNFDSSSELIYFDG